MTALSNPLLGACAKEGGTPDPKLNDYWGGEIWGDHFGLAGEYCRGIQGYYYPGALSEQIIHRHIASNTRNESQINDLFVTIRLESI